MAQKKVKIDHFFILLRHLESDPKFRAQNKSAIYSVPFPVACGGARCSLPKFSRLIKPIFARPPPVVPLTMLEFEFKFSRAIDAHGVKPWAIAVCGAVSGRDCARPCMAQSEATDRGAKCVTCVWRVVVRGAVSDMNRTLLYKYE